MCQPCVECVSSKEILQFRGVTGKTKNAQVICTVSDSEVMEQRMRLSGRTPGNASSDSNAKLSSSPMTLLKSHDCLLELP